jgi:hypothetical protein
MNFIKKKIVHGKKQPRDTKFQNGQRPKENIKPYNSSSGS